MPIAINTHKAYNNKSINGCITDLFKSDSPAAQINKTRNIFTLNPNHTLENLFFLFGNLLKQFQIFVPNS